MTGAKKWSQNDTRGNHAGVARREADVVFGALEVQGSRGRTSQLETCGVFLRQSLKLSPASDSSDKAVMDAVEHYTGEMAAAGRSFSDPTWLGEVDVDKWCSQKSADIKLSLI